MKMKKTIILLFAIMLAVLILLACASHETDTTNDENDYFPSSVNSEINGATITNDELDDNPKPVDYKEAAPTITLISREGSSSFWDNVFMGEGALPLSDGDERAWYTTVFGFSFHAISGLYLRIIDEDIHNDWIRQFHDGRRDNREFSKRAFIEDFGISLEELFQAAEAGYGMTMQEIDDMVMWAREWINYADRPPAPHDTSRRITFWVNFQFSLCDWYALFSNDVETVWNAFPGGGVFHNGRAYSAEWIMQNMERAIHEEGIPLHEIEGVFQRIEESFLVGMAEAVTAQSTFDAEMSAMRAATE